MNTTKISFLQRLAMAWRILLDGLFAQRIVQMQLEEPNASTDKAQDRGDTRGLSKTENQLNKTTAQDEIASSSNEWSDLQAGAAQVLALLQREGRFVDFISEDISGFADAEVGAAARAVHQGCAKVLHQHLILNAIRSEAEGTQIDVPSGFDPTRLSLCGQVQGAPPYRGQLLHPGWELSEISLPSRQGTNQNQRVIAPAEVEI